MTIHIRDKNGRPRYPSDDADKLRKSLLRHLGDKTSAIEALERPEAARAVMERIESKERETAAQPETGSPAPAPARER